MLGVSFRLSRDISDQDDPMIAGAGGDLARADVLPQTARLAATAHARTRSTWDGGLAAP
jgi:hypothetical protein